MKDPRSRPAQLSGQWRPTVSFWITAAILLLLLISSSVTSGFAGILMMLGVFALFSGLYGFIFKRRSWVGFPSRKLAGIAGASGLVVAMIGGAIAGPSVAAPGETDGVAAVAELPATPSPTPTEKSPALAACAEAETTREHQDQVFVCTENRLGKLVWLDEETSENLVADRAAEEKAAKEAAKQKAAEEAAAKEAAEKKAAAKKAAAEEAAAEKAAAEQGAAEQAAAEEAAAEQAAAERAAEEAALEQSYEAPSYVHPGSFCSGGTGVSKTGKAMVCAPASDGRLRWQSQ